MRVTSRIWRAWLDTRAAYARYANRARAKRGGIEVVFLGDSITKQWLDRQPGFFHRDWLNVGIGGETTIEMRSRFDLDVVAHRPRAVHIMAGTNDMWHGHAGPGAARAIQNIEVMVKKARDAGIAVILAPPPPIADDVVDTFNTPELFARLRAAIAEICARQALVHVDYASSLCDAAGRVIPANMTDGVHISRQGYRAMQDQAKAAVAQALGGHGSKPRAF